MDKATEQKLAAVWRDHRGKIIGSLCGFIFALVVMAAGVLWTLFILACVIAGYYLGTRLDDEDYDNLGDLWDRVVSRGDRPR